MCDFKKYIGGVGLSIFAPKKSVDQLVMEILEQYELKNAPIDPLIIAQSEGIEVFNAEFGSENVHGAIRKTDDTVEIFVKDDDIPTRKRFTISHELGHYFLHLDQREGKFIDNVNTLFRTSRNADPKEKEANQFAACLLMPRHLVENHWEYCYSVEQMSAIFNVSNSAMEYRLKNLGLI